MRLRTPFALLLGSALLLTGCGGDEPEPKFEAEPSASPTPTVAKEETAEEFIRRWAEVEQDMQDSGETAEYRAMTKGCESCGELADTMEKIHRDGGWVKSGKIAVRRIEEEAPGQYLVTLSIEPTSHSLTSEGPEGGFEGGKDLVQMNLQQTSTGWNLAHYTRRAS